MTSNPIYFTLPSEQGHWNPALDDEELLKGIDCAESRRNFVTFCALFAVALASTDAVLSFSVAELGEELGGGGNFVFFVSLTVSALLLAKPTLHRIGSKMSVVYGLVGMLLNVSLFFLAVLFPSIAMYIFYTGAAIGGLGAGLLWVGQGSYYSSNASEYSALADSNLSKVLVNFAGIFAAIFLFLEALLKLVATAVFVSSNRDVLAWKPTIYGLYTALAAIAISAFFFFVEDLDERIANDSDVEDNRQDSLANHSSHSTSSSAYSSMTARSLLQQYLAVGQSILTQPRLQLILPFQTCFGLSLGLTGSYLSRVIIRDHIGEGYLGLFSALSALTAAALAMPFSSLGAFFESGSHFLILLGVVCIASGAAMLLLLSDDQLAYWPALLAYCVFNGVARAVWENTNKALVAMFFPVEARRDVAYASMYFATGLSTAAGLALFPLLSQKSYLAAVVMVASAVAIVCFHFGFLLHKRVVQEEALAQLRGLTSSCSRSNSDSSLDSLTQVVFSPVSSSRAAK